MLKLFKKDLKLFFLDQRSVILTFLLPVILITLFAFAYGSTRLNEGRAEPVKLLVSDLDNSPVSKEIVHKIDALEDIKTVVSDTLHSRELVLKGEYAGALIIFKGFQDSIDAGISTPIELVYDKAKEAEVGIIQQNLMSTLISSTGKTIIINSIGKFFKEQYPDLNYELSENIIRNTINNNNSIVIKQTSLAGEKKGTNLGLIQAVAGTAILMLLFSVAGVGTSILEEKENGTINRLLYSPLKVSSVLLGKMLFAFFISVLQLTVMFLFAWLIFNLDLTTNIPALILMIIATAFAVSGLGIFMAAIARTRHQAQNISTIVILVMSALGGSMIPLFIMPAILQKVALLSINYWGIQGFYDIFWRQLPLNAILLKIIILLIFGSITSFASLWLFKKRIINLS